MERASRKTTMGSASRGGWHSLPNHAVEPTPKSLRSCVAPAIGRGSPPAFGFQVKTQGIDSRKPRPFNIWLFFVHCCLIENKTPLAGGDNDVVGQRICPFRSGATHLCHGPWR